MVKIKLTERQQKLITAMGEGWVLSANNLIGFDYSPTIKKGDDSWFVKMNTVSSLLQRNIIAHNGDVGMFHFYKLTEIGEQLATSKAPKQ